MSGILELMQTLSVALGGLVVRAATVLVVMLALLIPALVLVGAWRALRDVAHRAHGLRREGDVAFRRGVRLMENHTWVDSLRDGLARIGVDDVARRLFPHPTRVETVPVGRRVAAGDTVATVVSGRRRAAITAPIDGTVRRVNPALTQAPAVVAEDPYFDGWLVEVEPEPAAWPRVKAAEDGPRWLSRELSRFTTLVEHELGMAAADGGEPHLPVMEALADDQWTRVASTVLDHPRPTRA